MRATMMPPTFDLDVISAIKLLETSDDLPDSLKHNQTSSDTVGGYLHYVDLADNLENTDPGAIA
jgi:hypothetical protein